MINIVIDKEVVDGYVDTLRQCQQLLSEAFIQRDAAQRLADESRLMGIREACAYLGNINEDTLLHYRKMGLDYYKKGKGGVWYRKGDIDSWLASGRVNRQSR